MRLDIHHYHHDCSGRSAEEIKLLREILTLQRKMALTVEQLSAKVDELQQTVDTEQQEVANALAKLETTVQELRDEIAAGGNSEALQAIGDKIDSIIADVKTTIPNLPDPEPEEPTDPSEPV